MSSGISSKVILLISEPPSGVTQGGCPQAGNRRREGIHSGGGEAWPETAGSTSSSLDRELIAGRLDSFSPRLRPGAEKRG